MKVGGDWLFKIHTGTDGWVGSVAIPGLLYLLTGVATAIPVMWALGGVWLGVGTSPAEFFSLLGSLALLVSAAVPRRRRLAAQIALVGATGIWSFYLPGIVDIAKAHLSAQELRVRVLLWTPSALPLAIKEPTPIPKFPDMRLSPVDIQQIKDTGITGAVLSNTANRIYGSGRKSGVILIMQRPVSEAIELKEPDAASIVYIQDGQKWKIFPPNAPLLKRTIRIEPDAGNPNQVSVMVEVSSGGRAGFGVLWSKAKLENTGR